MFMHGIKIVLQGIARKEAAAQISVGNRFSFRVVSRGNSTNVKTANPRQVRFWMSDCYFLVLSNVCFFIVVLDAYEDLFSICSPSRRCTIILSGWCSAICICCIPWSATLGIKSNVSPIHTSVSNISTRIYTTNLTLFFPALFFLATCYLRDESGLISIT